MGYVMVENYPSAGFCLERAAEYEQKAERAVDPAARQSFLEVAAKWRQSAEIHQSVNSARAGNSESLQISVGAPTQSASFAQRVFSKLGSWSRWLRLNRAPF